jgi:alkylhydroperoxidase/carboxymuconolactone decarboxylase family protein YurZ
MSTITNYNRMLNQMRQDMPRMVNGFAELQQMAIADASLNSKTKHLTALAIAILRGNEDSFTLHAGEALQNGATTAEIREAIGMAILIGGEPAAFNASKVYDRVDQLKVSVTR